MLSGYIIGSELTCLQNLDRGETVQRSKYLGHELACIVATPTSDYQYVLDTFYFISILLKASQFHLIRYIAQSAPVPQRLQDRFRLLMHFLFEKRLIRHRRRQLHLLYFLDKVYPLLCFYIFYHLHLHLHICICIFVICIFKYENIII